MGNVKINMEADSLKEFLEDLTGALEEMGAIVVKGNDDPSESLEKMLASKGMLMFKPGQGIPEGLLISLLKEDQEEVVDAVIGNPESLARIVQSLEEKGYQIQQPEKKNSWD